MLGEPILEPDLPIIDAHHHLWLLPEAALAALEGRTDVYARMLAPVLRRRARYLFDEYLADVASGHDVRASVFVEAHTMYRQSGPEHLRSIGEVEFVNGVAAMAASGLFGEVRVCAGIVGGVDLKMGAQVEEVLAAHLAACGGRYRGVRSSVVHDADVSILGARGGCGRVMSDERFRQGFGRLAKFGLSFDAWVLEPQLPELTDLARAFADTQIILNHAGAPVGVGRYAGQREERFGIWRAHLLELAQCPNVAVKVGGFGIPFAGFGSYLARPPWNSAQLATEWKPYIQTCIEAFGVERCMFESNFPVDASVGCYATVWNAFKRVVAGASVAEKTALFSDTAAKVYRL